MNDLLSKLHFMVLAGAAVLVLSISAWAQTAASTVPPSRQQPQPPPAKAQPPRKTIRRPTTPVRVTVIPDKTAVAPQVVTVVHRLSGIKMLRFVLRQQGEAGTVAMIDPFSIMSDAHASIIAGWALDDKTIAARLPQAAAEIDFPQFATASTEFAWPAPGVTAPHDRGEVDLTVITRDGRRLAARYVGLDGMTGLSVLQVNGLTAPPATPAAKPLTVGEMIQLFAPERTEPGEAATPGIIYVRVGETEAKIAALERLTSGKLQRLTVQAARLSPEVVGGVACDTSGNALGIVDAIEGDSAQLLAAEAIKDAARRVLERQASVPRPLLGIRGEPVEFSSRTQFVANGWHEEQLTKLFNDQIGILLLQVMPGTPAASAELRRGDVIVKVNDDAVKSAEDFSDLLGMAGSGEQVKFTVMRPDSLAPVPVTVKLGATFDQIWTGTTELRLPSTAQTGLVALGIQTVPLAPRAAFRLAARNGLLVVAIQPQSVAARSGVREGDVIESIDGRAVGHGLVRFNLIPRKKHVLSIVRNREKTQVELEANN